DDGGYCQRTGCQYCGAGDERGEYGSAGPGKDDQQRQAEGGEKRGERGQAALAPGQPDGLVEKVAGGEAVDLRDCHSEENRRGEQRECEADGTIGPRLD